MLLMLDLDNTLVDRTGAFRRWATTFVPADEVPWLMAADADGYERRDVLAGKIVDRYGGTVADVLTMLRAATVGNLTLDPAIADALRDAAAAGFEPVVVSNGSAAQQAAKIRHTGLDRLVRASIISEAAGVRKPDRRIFELAAQAVGRTLESGGWMIGDHAAYDVGGGAAAGLRTVWLDRGRAWPGELPYRPDHVRADCAGAIRAALAG